jgi:hypothetical protein
LGGPLGKQFSALRQELAILFINWLEYVELFGTKSERIDLTNKAVPTFFRRVQDGLWGSDVTAYRAPDRSTEDRRKRQSHNQQTAKPHSRRNVDRRVLA